MHYIDISRTLDGDTPVYPGDIRVRLEDHKTAARDGYALRTLTTGMHAGTHIDFPAHFVAGGGMASDYPPECFAGRGVLLDVRGRAVVTMKPEYGGMVREGDIVLLYTGHDTVYGTDGYYTDHPVVDDELCGFLIDCKVKMLGMDMPAPDRPPFPVHRRLLDSGIFLLENLTNLGALIGLDGFEVMAFPLRIAAEGSLVRAVCRATGGGEVLGNR